MYETSSTQVYASNWKTREERAYLEMGEEDFMTFHAPRHDYCIRVGFQEPTDWEEKENV